MKKIFAVLTIATVFLACGGGEQAPAETPATPVVDTTKKDTVVAAPVAPAVEAPKAEAHKAKKH